jgi:hypothetical protein
MYSFGHLQIRPLLKEEVYEAFLLEKEGKFFLIIIFPTKYYKLTFDPIHRI